MSSPSFGETMSNLIGDDTQSLQDEEDREGEKLCLKIKAQLEDLFSDGHLAEDGFLLKHLQKNKQGYISLKLLTCLKKIKVLTTNWYMTLAGAGYSDLLEVNDECTKVRRIQPLPKWLLGSPTSKLLLTWNFPEEQRREDGGNEHSLLSERILQKFSVHGSVKSVCILYPGKELPKELQCYTKHHKELGQQLSAVVKFDSLEAVRKAFKALKAEGDMSPWKGLCVVPLGFHSTHHLTTDKLSEEKNVGHPEGDTASLENPLELSKDIEQQEPSSPIQLSDEIPDTPEPQTSLDNSTQGTFNQILTSCNGQPWGGLSKRDSRMNWCSGDYDKESSCSPWVLRRKSAASALNTNVAGHLNARSLIQRVLRQPFPPGDNKGFRGRNITVAGRDQTSLDGAARADL